jgi:triphosphoribosyl-dephospho-CoA synthase
MSSFGLEDDIARAIQLAILLEVSAYPKPGNVHRTAGYPPTRYEHFLASAVSMYPSIRRACVTGTEIAKGARSYEQAHLGRLIRDSVDEVMSWQNGGNTSLGTVLLVIPLTVASALARAVAKDSCEDLREVLTRLIRSATPEDTVEIFKAIRSAKPGGLGASDEYDVFEPNVDEQIMRKGVVPLDVFRISSDRDSISSEWASSFDFTFRYSYPTLLCELQETRDINVATVHTFLRILAERPDTLIARKTTIEKSRYVSARAKSIMDMGGLQTSEGARAVNAFDQDLRSEGNLLNPGTTADLTVAALCLLTLHGYRP